MQKEVSDKANTPWPNKITLQSLYHDRRWEPSAHADQIEVPSLYIMATRDEYNPIEYQEPVFEKLGGQKEKVVLQSGNLEAFANENTREQMLGAIGEFLRRVFCIRNRALGLDGQQIFKKLNQ
jgi:fermentation-respiration switch protein FrsA (DUF1100 family)